MAWKTTKNKIEVIIQTMARNNATFAVKRKRENVSIIYNGKVESYYNKEQTQIGAVSKIETLMITRLVANSVNEYIIRNNFQIPVIEQLHKNNYTNLNAWSDMPIGAPFFYIDINRAYWTIAWLHAYISDSLFHTYVDQPGYKTVLSRALACIIASEKMDYFHPQIGSWRIEEDRSMHIQIHKNIRHFCWNLMGELTELLDYECIGYRTDAMMVKRDQVQSVKDFLDNNALQYTVKKCIKVGDKYYKVADLHFNHPNEAIKRF